MVPSLERPEYMYELRNIADNIVRERCKHSAVHFPAHTEGVQMHKVAEDSHDHEPPLGARPANDSPSTHETEHAGPAFHIPMTQEKSLQDLPSQLDFDWQDSATPGPSTAAATARNSGEELDVLGTPTLAASPMHVDVDTFVQVSQMGHEAVMDAIHQETPVPPSTTTSGIADATSL